MKEDMPLQEFSLLGGPLHRLGCRLGLVRGGTNTLPLGLAIGLVFWGITMLLALSQGRAGHTFSLEVIGGHLRLLVVIPLFFMAESWLDPRMTAFVRTIVRSGALSRGALPAMKSAIASTARWKDSWVPEAVCLALALVLPLIAPWLHLVGTTAVYDPSRAGGVLGLADLWYALVCLTVFRFLMFRWLWRLALWTSFLWRVARMDLHLLPTHPDGTAGIGYLEVVHMHFAPLVMSLSIVQAGSIAEQISTGMMAFDQIFPSLAIVLVVDAVLFLGPMFVFSRKLWICRVNGLANYSELAERYVSGFDKKWMTENAPPEEPLLGTADIQSLADLSNSVAIIRNMRVVPISWHLLINLTIAAALPALPLFLFKYPAAELLQKLFSKLVGL